MTTQFENRKSPELRGLTSRREFLKDLALVGFGVVGGGSTVAHFLLDDPLPKEDPPKAKKDNISPIKFLSEKERQEVVKDLKLFVGFYNYFEQIPMSRMFTTGMVEAAKKVHGILSSSVKRLKQNGFEPSHDDLCVIVLESLKWKIDGNWPTSAHIESIERFIERLEQCKKGKKEI